MAKISDTAGSSNIWLGSKQNTRQTILYVPASGVAGGGTADKPGLLFLEAVDSSGDIQAGLYLWADSADALHVSATYPTNEDDAGSLYASGGDCVMAAVAGHLLPATDTIYDLGSTTKEFGTLWIDEVAHIDDLEAEIAWIGDGATKTNCLKVAASGVITTEGTATINGITLTNNSNEIKMTKGTASFEIAAGDTDLIIGAAGSLDVAAGKDVDINMNLTVNTANVTLDQDLQAADSPTFVGLTLTGAIATPTTISISSFLALADDQQIKLGNTAGDSYIQYDASNDDLEFYDRSAGGPFTLGQLIAGTNLNPIVTGDFTISDGQFDWGNAAGASDTNTWIFQNATTDIWDIQANSLTSADAFCITADGMTSGSMIKLDTDQASGTFHFIECLQESTADAFTVTFDGITVIKGDAIETAALTLTTGDLVLSDGFLDLDSSNVDGGHNIASVQNATSNTPLLTLTNDQAAYDQPLLQLTPTASGDIDVMNVSNSGTGYSFSSTLALAGGEGVEIIFATGGTHNGIFIDGGTGTYVGADTYGMLKIHQTGTLVHANASAIFVDFDGVPAANGLGYALLIDDDATATATTYAVSIHSENNVPLKLEGNATTKETLRLEATAAQTASTMVIDGATNDWDGADNVGMLQIDGNTALADAGAAHLVIRNTGGAAPVNNATGHLARFEDLSNGGAGTNEYAVEIYSDNNEALNVSKGASIFVGAVTMSSTLGVTAATTFTAGQQSAAVARTSGDGTGTAAIADGTTYVTTTSGNAANWFKLPTPTPGNVVWLGPNATGHEVRSDTPASVAINGGTGADAESAVGANVTVRFVCTSSTTWVATTYAANGTEAALEAAA